MALYPESPIPQFPYSITEVWKTTITGFDSGKEQRRQKQVFPKYDMVFTYDVLDLDDFNVLWNFYHARRGSYEAFYVYLPDQEPALWEGLGVGTGDGETRIFDLPGKSTSSQKIYINGEEHLKCSHIMWDLLDDPCASLDGWTDVDDGDAATTQVEFDGCDCFRLDSGINSAANDDYAGIDRNVGSLGSATTIELSLYCEAIGDRENIDHFFFGIADGATYAAFHISSTGFFANDGTGGYAGGYVEVGEDLVQQGAWQKWRIVIDWAAQTADVYLDDVLQASGVSVANESAVSEGTVRVRQYGYGTNNRVSYIDHLKIGNKAYLIGGGEESSDRVEFVTAPAENEIISCDFAGYMRNRCRFANDKMTRTQFAHALYSTGLELKGLAMI